MVSALIHAVRHDLPGAYNVGADGVLALSEVASLLGKPFAPVLPPWGTGVAFRALRRAGLNAGPETLRQLRFGRALDNRKLKATGFRYRYTTRETVLKVREHQRLDPLMRANAGQYRYERAVEDFLRWSPSVNRRREDPDRTLTLYDDLRADELIALLPSLEPASLTALREHEAANRSRRAVLAAIDANLVRQKTS
jgi:UDP-glucose 4-epimerase